MDAKKKLTEETISDIILCEPITNKGREELIRLGLTTEDITPVYFYDNIRVPSKYDMDKEYDSKVDEQDFDRNSLYYQYTVDKIQFYGLKEKLEKFHSRFYSNSPNEYPLYMTGVAGNGKSIEINRQIRDITFGKTEYEKYKVYLDLEDAFTKVTYGIEYQCPEKTSLWLFCIKLLNEIMEYIKCCCSLCPTILQNFNSIIVKENLATEKQVQLFQKIGNYSNGVGSDQTELFRSLISFLGSKDACKDIEILLETLMLIMYCAEPEKKHYIVIDNIEQYILLNDEQIQIPESDLTQLSKTIGIVVANITNSFNRISEDLAWRAFKIIIVLRRTSLALLDPALLHSTAKTKQNVTDITGHFQMSDIWEKKKKYIWNDRLRDKFNHSENEKIINIVDNIINDGIQKTGIDYQSLIAPLMSYGIRRNAKAQAHAAYSTYKMLTGGSEKNINYDEFIKLMNVEGKDNSAIRYMFRRALIEFQFKWVISCGRLDRWENLGIGHLVREKTICYKGKYITIEEVAYHNSKCVTLMRRILTYLSYFPEKREYTNGRYKTVADMFLTCSLFDLIQGVLVSPRGCTQIPDDEFFQFARVLMALSDMSNDETKSAPYVILSIKDDNFHKNTNVLVLAELLKKIWNDGYENSILGEKNNSYDFGARITDAGNSFLLDWQASFSLIASLHCFTVPPLFFLKDILSIEYVIETVYEASSKLCIMYEQEARRFCGNNYTLKRGKYLPRYNNRCITFRERVRELHIRHLNLYKDFIKKNYNNLGIPEKDMQELTDENAGFVSQYIEKYNGWMTMEEVPECF